MPDTPITLQPNELSRIGWGSPNHAAYRVEWDDDVFRILPPRAPWVSWVVGTTLIASGFIGFWWGAGYLQATGRADLHPLIRPGVLAFGAVVVSLVLIGWVWSHRSVVRQGVPFAFDRRTRMVYILNGKHAFHADQIIAVQSLTEWNRFSNGRLGNRGGTELTIIVTCNGERQRHHLLATVDGRPTYFDYILNPLREITSLPVVRCYRQGFAGRGEMVTETLE